MRKDTTMSRKMDQTAKHIRRMHRSQDVRTTLRGYSGAIVSDLDLDGDEFDLETEETTGHEGRHFPRYDD